MKLFLLFMSLFGLLVAGLPGAPAADASVPATVPETTPAVSQEMTGNAELVPAKCLTTCDMKYYNCMKSCGNMPTCDRICDCEVSQDRFCYDECGWRVAGCHPPKN